MASVHTAVTQSPLSPNKETLLTETFYTLTRFFEATSNLPRSHTERSYSVSAYRSTLSLVKIAPNKQTNESETSGLSLAAELMLPRIIDWNRFVARSGKRKKLPFSSSQLCPIMALLLVCASRWTNIASPSAVVVRNRSI